MTIWFIFAGLLLIISLCMLLRAAIIFFRPPVIDDDMEAYVCLVLGLIVLIFSFAVWHI